MSNASELTIDDFQALEPTGPAARGVTKGVAQRLARHCLAYRDADDGRAMIQLATTFAAFVVLCGVLLWGAANQHWLLMLLAVPAGGLLVRLFIVQHDCGHGSFFTSRTMNNWTGRLISVLTLTPYGYWKRAHAMHHASSGDLSRRGIGDVDTLTVREYLALPPRERQKYRIYRHPLVLHVLGPPLYFVLFQRSPFGQALPAGDAWRSIMGLNASILAFYGSLAFAFGPLTVALVFLPIASVASWVGGWLFFVQHQFEHTHWEESEAWDFQLAALGGSSHYVLPPILQWFTGSVGLHHIHHLNSRIPNYRLQECLEADDMLGSISRLTLRESFSCIGLALWDEESRKLVGFSDVRAASRAVEPA